MAPNWRQAIRFLGGSPEREQELIQEMARQIREVVENLTDENGNVRRRPQHAKMVAGITGAEFRVSPDIPEDLRVGFLRPGASYPALVRFSNAAGFVRKDDAEPDLRGAAVKVKPNEGGEHDFLMTNAEEHHAKDALEAMATSLSFSREGVLQQIVGHEDEGQGESDEDTSRTHERVKKLDSKVSGLAELAGRVGPLDALHILRTLKKQMSVPVESLATETYWSRAPLRIGEAVVKYRLLPVTPKAKRPKPRSDLRGELKTRLEGDEVRFQFQVQRYVDEDLTPLENAREVWKSRHDTIAELVLPRRGVAEDEGFFEGLIFTPWHLNTDDFEPVGNMNRARKAVYPAAVEARGQRPA